MRGDYMIDTEKKKETKKIISDILTLDEKSLQIVMCSVMVLKAREEMEKKEKENQTA
jgi:hypothetical protein